MKVFKVEENDADQRLDKFLKKLFPNATSSLIYKINRKEKVKIKENGKEEKYKKKDNEYRLKLGDEVKIFLSDDEIKLLQDDNIKKKQISSHLEKKDIVYEDGDILVVNKNPGKNVHPGDHKTKEVSLIEEVNDYLGDKYDSLTFKPSLVHRIDRDTSGIVIIAKKKDILVKLVNDFKSHKKVKKTYYALVFNKMSHDEGTIKKKLKRIENAQNENKVQVRNDGQDAITHYKLLNEYLINSKNGEITISELEVEIETGRMHQIRVHLSSIGNPIVGDKLYGDKKLNSYIEKNYSLNRQALHAKKIEFFHYSRKKKIILDAKLKEDINEFISKIK